MPGPVSDSYHPEFGTAEKADEFRDCVQDVYGKVSKLIKSPPVDFRTLPELKAGKTITGALNERDWRFIRYALESLAESI